MRSGKGRDVQSENDSKRQGGGGAGGGGGGGGAGGGSGMFSLLNHPVYNIIKTLLHPQIITSWTVKSSLSQSLFHSL